MDYNKLALEMHESHKGKISVTSKVEVKTRDDLSTAYTPGVAEPCRKIRDDKKEVYRYTAKGNLVAVVSDGTAVLGLGDIGPEAAMPVMEGKAILFKTFADIDAFPICLDTKDPDEIVKTVKYLAPTFGGINLEDISAPRCFEIERRLKEELDIPVFHDDQHGTAIVVSAGLLGALKLVKKDIHNVKAVINGAGSAGISICKLLLELGIGDVVLVDRKGALAVGEDWMNPAQAEMAQRTNAEQIRDGFHHGEGCHRLCHGQPHPGNYAGRSQEGRRTHRGHRPQRLPEPDQQCAGIPRHLPWCAGRTGHRHHRGDEDRRGSRHCRHHPGRGAKRGLHHPRCVR